MYAFCPLYHGGGGDEPNSLKYGSNTKMPYYFRVVPLYNTSVSYL